MQIIHKLQPAVANQIAAGEVITEPVSVVKELVENALDAGAGEITVEIRGGGLQFIQVADNGRGIYSQDVELLFERHATSKLSTAHDLYRIGSLGFRGEALASIAAISKVTVQSRSRDEMQGFELIQYGANRLRHTRLAKPPGTSVTVEDLFFNTPVREQFLAKSSQLERNVSQFMRAFALGHPGVRFRYLSDDQVVFVTHGDGSPEKAVYDILGKDVAQALVPVAIETADFTITGFISNQLYSRSNRSFQFFYVNGRLVENPELTQAVAKAYEGLLMQRRFPVALLWLTTDYSLVDVNVHPRKLEVRLSESLRLAQLADQLRAILRDKPTQLSVPLTASRPAKPEKKPEPIDYQQISLGEIRRHQEIVRDTTAREIHQPGEEFAQFISGLRPIGQFAASYLLFEKDDRLIVMDQHAAHEKVLYEAFMRSFEQADFKSQILLLPLTVDVLPEEMRAFQAGIGEAEFGFEVEVFSPHQLLIRAIPHLFSQEQARHFFEELLSQQRSPSAYHREALVMQSCKAAIKAHHAVEELEARQLLAQLLPLDDPLTCPHGRPIFVEISRQELERRFERT